jgi:hypothetical protein
VLKMQNMAAGRRLSRRRQLMMATAATGIACASVTLGISARPAVAGPAPRGSVPAAALPGLAAAAYRQAAAEGDRSPVSAHVVLTTEAKALAMADTAATIRGAARVPVYLVIMRGHFTPAGIPVPPGFVPPSGPDLEMLFSTSTMQLLVMGVGGPSLHTPTVTTSMLERLGTVTALSRPAG